MIKLAKFKLFLDAGHGGHDSGAVGNGLKEKDIVLEVCQRVDNYLAKHYPDIECLLSRNDDIFVELRDRTSKANRLKSDCLVSVHVNSAADNRANGFESFIYTTDDETTNHTRYSKSYTKSLLAFGRVKAGVIVGRRKPTFTWCENLKALPFLLSLVLLLTIRTQHCLNLTHFCNITLKQ